MRLARVIALPDVRGRIDHLALDPRTNHLLVAELGNGTVEDVDLGSGTVVGRIPALHEPQGVAWLPGRQEIVVACGDGTVRFYRRLDLREVARISLGDDADNVRIDSRNGDVVVGFGSGALAVIDPSTHRLIREVALSAHPEAFAILGARVFVNVPNDHKIVLADLDAARVLQTFGTGMRFGNYPMAADATGSRVALAFRSPGILAILDAPTGAITSSASICGDADDVHFRGNSVVVVCGEGVVQIVGEGNGQSSTRIATMRGARTGLLDTEHDRLFVAVPDGEGPAAIWELEFQPERRSQSQ